ncbi:GlsB/YeaQ/YmgE family stress response membrane protein [Amycolatopsis sp. cmx-11-12]
MGILAWIVLGLVAKSLSGGRAKHGLVVTILVGVAGAVLKSKPRWRVRR